MKYITVCPSQKKNMEEKRRNTRSGMVFSLFFLYSPFLILPLLFFRQWCFKSYNMPYAHLFLGLAKLAPHHWDLLSYTLVHFWASFHPSVLNLNAPSFRLVRFPGSSSGMALCTSCIISSCGTTCFLYNSIPPMGWKCSVYSWSSSLS